MPILDLAKHVTLAKHAIQSQLRRTGWEVKRLNTGDIADLVRELEGRGVSRLLDVGANIGQYANAVLYNGFSGEIISFEPLGDIHGELAKAAATHPRWNVHDRCAVGAEAGTITINRASNAVSSSILPIEDLHVSAAPSSQFTATEDVAVIALDDLALTDCERTFLKVDTQGFEGEVLKGAVQLLPRIAGAQLEISIAPLYKGQADYAEVFDILHRAGLRLWSVEPGFRDPASNCLLQFDAIFMR